MFMAPSKLLENFLTLGTAVRAGCSAFLSEDIVLASKIGAPAA
jgi:hypothetical protein